MSMSLVKDPSLAVQGRQKIEWVRDFMPTLTSIGEDLAREQVFAGLKIGMSIHMEAKTAYLATVLRNAGAEVCATGCNPLSTQDDVAAGLAEEPGITVFAMHNVDECTYKYHLQKTLDFQPDLIIDDGGDLLETFCEQPSEAKWQVIGGCEETTTGVLRLRQREHEGTLPFPMMDINDAKCKHYYDNRYGTGQSVWTAMMGATNCLVAGKTVVVAGYGYCGRGIAMRARGMGANVIVTEIDPIKALEANLDGFTVMPMEKAAILGDFFVTATGCKDVITAKHFEVMKNNAFLANAGHFDVEINLNDLANMAELIIVRRNGIDGYHMVESNKHCLHGQFKVLNVLARGRLVNLAAGDGHPAEIMDMSFALQAMGLKYLVENRNKLDCKVYDLPDEIDQRVAKIKLKSMGIEIDQLSSEQREYLGLM